MNSSLSNSSKSQEKVICISCGHETPSDPNNFNLCPNCIMDRKFKIQISDPEKVSNEVAKIFNCFVNDVTEAFHKDPAANSLVEVLTSYPGIKAVLLYRVAHFFWELGLPFVPRYIAELAHEQTGIDIHPGAKIGDHFFIDHGTGVVIGETAEIGNNVTIYQGVTLGGVSLDKEKRHPTLGNNIIIGTGAKLLGPITIGDNVKVGANSVVTKDIPPNSVVIGVPARIIKNAEHVSDEIKLLSHGILPDPVKEIIAQLEERIAKLENKDTK